jgi:hypothetical protein
MKKGNNAAEVLEMDDEMEELEIPGGEYDDRTLVLKKEIPPRKVQLMAHGVREIRCLCCNQIRPIAGAEEIEEGWICEYCMAEMMAEPKCGGQAGR